MTNEQRIAFNAIVYKACMNKTASMQKEAGITDLLGQLRYLKGMKVGAPMANWKRLKPVSSSLKALFKPNLMGDLNAFGDFVTANKKWAVPALATLGLGADAAGAYGLYNLFKGNKGANAGINAAAGGLAGLAAGGGLYAGLGAIPALKRKKLLRALIAGAGGLSAAGLGAMAANNYQQNA